MPFRWFPLRVQATASMLKLHKSPTGIYLEKVFLLTLVQQTIGSNPSSAMAFASAQSGTSFIPLAIYFFKTAFYLYELYFQAGDQVQTDTTNSFHMLTRHTNQPVAGTILS